jgi:mannose-6-phosphate isomerase-like protein (cupin superfamily)
MIQYLQLPVLFDAQKMQQEMILMGKQFWKLHFQVKHYDGQWSAIPLRSIDGSVDNEFLSPVEDATIYKDTVLLQQSPYLQQVLRFFECPLMAVRLLKLTPGTQIHEHRDRDLSFEQGQVRFHIPVVTNPQIEFILHKEQMYLKEGECWYMNFNLPHSLHNQSKKDRVHLVIDAVVNDWVIKLFESSAVLNKKGIADIPKHTQQEQTEMIAHLRSMNTDTAHKLADEIENNLR